MLTLAMGAAMAAPGWGGLKETAETLESGEWVVRLPTGRSAVGLSDRSELWVTPFDLLVGGTRVGLEQVVLDGPLGWSLTPSVAEKWSLRKTALQLDSVWSWTHQQHRVNLIASADLRLMRRATLTESVSHQWSVDRLHVPLTVSYDHTLGDTVLRGRVMVPLLDEGVPATFAVVSGDWIHRFGRLHLALGAGTFVGRPSEHLFLGTYDHLIVAAYPRLDLWVQL